MITFKRYPHVGKLIHFYIEEGRRGDIATLMQSGIRTQAEARLFCQFIWATVDRIYRDKEQGKLVLDRDDNTEMLPDLSYEVSNYMRKSGFFSLWKESAG